MTIARVVAVDVGSVKNNFTWAALDLPGRVPLGNGGRDPEVTALAVLEALMERRPVALGFEAPPMVPVSPVGESGWTTLGKARRGEAADGRSRPWSAGAGAGALATGLVQVAWVLERLASEIPRLRCTTRPERWLTGDADLFIWEAFVSGAGKPVPGGISQHAADAAAAADTFADRMEEGSLSTSDVACAPSSSFNLAAAAAAYARLEVESDELSGEVRVYRTRPAL